MTSHLNALLVLLTAFQVATDNHHQHHGILLVNANNVPARQTAVTIRRRGLDRGVAVDDPGDPGGTGGTGGTGADVDVDLYC